MVGVPVGEGEALGSRGGLGEGVLRSGKEGNNNKKMEILIMFRKKERRAVRACTHGHTGGRLFEWGRREKQIFRRSAPLTRHTHVAYV